MNGKRLFWHLIAIGIVCVWGSCFIMTNEMMRYYSAIEIIPMRMGMGYLTLLLIHPPKKRYTFRQELIFVGFGLLGGSIYYLVQNSAINYMAPSNVSIIYSLSPMLGVVITHFLPGGKRKWEKNVFLGGIIAILGIVLVVTEGKFEARLNLTGVILAFLAGLFWALYTIVVSRYSPSDDTYETTRKMLFWATVTSVPMVLATGGIPDLTFLVTVPRVLVSWLLLGVLGTGLAYVLWNVSIDRLGLIITNNYLYGISFAAMAAEALLYHTKILPIRLLGAVLITFGVIIAGKTNAMIKTDNQVGKAG